MYIFLYDRASYHKFTLPQITDSFLRHGKNNLLLFDRHSKDAETAYGPASSISSLAKTVRVFSSVDAICI